MLDIIHYGTILHKIVEFGRRLRANPNRKETQPSRAAAPALVSYCWRRRPNRSMQHPIPGKALREVGRKRHTGPAPKKRAALGPVNGRTQRRHLRRNDTGRKTALPRKRCRVSVAA